MGLGTIIVLLAALADVIGIGSHPDSFGYRQFLGVIVGSVLIVIGLALMLYQNGSKNSS